MKALFILNDAPYGSERTYNGLRLAGALAQNPANIVRVFLMGDAVLAGKDHQKPASGFYNIGLMLDRILKSNGEVHLCGTCMDARGMAQGELLTPASRGTLDELREWTEWADQVLVY
jgi:uncharacterized protein involved in oxidation of intracellular sulfur